MTHDHQSAIEAIPDPLPTPDAIVADLDDADILASMQSAGELCRRLALLILSFPPELSHALCRMVVGEGTDASVAAIARQCGIPRTTARRYIARARQAYARLYGGREGADGVPSGSRGGQGGAEGGTLGGVPRGGGTPPGGSSRSRDDDNARATRWRAARD